MRGVIWWIGFPSSTAWHGSSLVADETFAMRIWLDRKELAARKPCRSVMSRMPCVQKISNCLRAASIQWIVVSRSASHATSRRRKISNSWCRCAARMVIWSASAMSPGWRRVPGTAPFPRQRCPDGRDRRHQAVEGQHDRGGRRRQARDGAHQSDTAGGHGHQQKVDSSVFIEGGGRRGLRRSCSPSRWSCR